MLVALAAVSRRVKVEDVAAFLAARPGVVEVHDLQVWPLGSTGAALSAHLGMPHGHPGDAAPRELAHDVAERFGVGHAVFQIALDHPTVRPPASACALWFGAKVKRHRMKRRRQSRRGARQDRRPARPRRARESAAT